MSTRREFAKAAPARLAGLALAPGMFKRDAVAALKGAARPVVIDTHEHWGDIEERLDFPAGWEINLQVMAGHNAPVLNADQIRRRLQDPIGTRPLREIAAGKKTAVITFDDLTRPTPTAEVVPFVLEELAAAGVPDRGIVFLGSYGTHRNLEQDEVVRKLGKDVTRRFPWINHNIWENCKDVGTTSYKTPVQVNQTFVSADVKVSISGVKVHGGAGYGGGAKAILPGVASMATIHHNHTMQRRPLPPDKVAVWQNDMRLDMIEAARLAKVDFSVQIVYNGKRRTCGVFAGEIAEAHYAASRMANRHYRTPVLKDADVVVANGYPQSTQAPVYAASWLGKVREGGTSVLVLQHPQGISSWHFANERNYGKNSRTYYDVMATPRFSPPKHARLIVFSQYLDRQNMNKFGAGTEFAFTWEDVIRKLQARHRSSARVALYPYCPIQHPEFDLDAPAGA